MWLPDLSAPLAVVEGLLRRDAPWPLRLLAFVILAALVALPLMFLLS